MLECQAIESAHGLTSRHLQWLALAIASVETEQGGIEPETIQGQGECDELARRGLLRMTHCSPPLVRYMPRDGAWAVRDVWHHAGWTCERCDQWHSKASPHYSVSNCNQTGIGVSLCRLCALEAEAVLAVAMWLAPSERIAWWPR